MSQAAAYDNTVDHDDHDGHDHEIMPISTYMKVYGALVVLTILTVLVSFVDLGPASFAAAMVVAVIKASVVAAYFMHLKYDDRLYTLAFLAGTLFVALFFSFTYMDLFTRSDLTFATGNHEYERDRNWQEYIANQPAGGGEEAAAGEGGAAAVGAPEDAGAAGAGDQGTPQPNGQ